MNGNITGPIGKYQSKILAELDKVHRRIARNKKKIEKLSKKTI